MQSGLGRRILVGFVLVVTAYIVAAQFVPTRLLIKIGDGFAVPMSVAACLVYFLELWRRPGNEPLTATDMVMLGIAGGWMVNSFDRALRLWARIIDIRWLDEPIVGLFLFMLTFFAALHVHVRGGSSRASGLSMRGSRVVAAALAGGAVMAAIIVYLEFK